MSHGAKRSLFASCKIICYCCLCKDLKCFSLETYPSIVLLIKQFIDCGFDLDVNSNPTGVCPQCKKNLYAKKVSHSFLNTIIPRLSLQIIIALIIRCSFFHDTYLTTTKQFLHSIILLCFLVVAYHN